MKISWNWEILLILIITISLPDWAISGDDLTNLSRKKAAIIIAENNYRDEELLKPMDIMESYGIKITIFSTSLKDAVGMLGVTIKPDQLISDLNIKKYDAIIFIGGLGASQYWFSDTAHRIARETVNAGKILCAICIAPVTLANAGVLSGRKATVWRSEARKLIKKGAVYTGTNVQVDENIITANGPLASAEFAHSIIRLLSKN